MFYTPAQLEPLVDALVDEVLRRIESDAERTTPEALAGESSGVMGENRAEHTHAA